MFYIDNVFEKTVCTIFFGSTSYDATVKLVALKNAMVINKMASKIYKFVGACFVVTVFVSSIISSHVIIESPIILLTYLPFSRQHVARLQK